MNSLPRELQLYIIKGMDIDARRLCGLFFKLKVPETLKTKISKTFVKPMPKNIQSSQNELALFRFPKETNFIFWHQTFNTIMDEKLFDDDYSIKTKNTLRFVKSRLVDIDHSKPFLIKAGYIDEDDHLHYQIVHDWEIKDIFDTLIEFGLNYNKY